MTPVPDADRYPKRPPFFANRFLAYALRSAVNMDCGAQAFTLLAAVVLTEDKIRYRRPVKFWNDNLTAYLGCREDRLIDVRRRLVAAGWLHYAPGRKGIAGSYWVLVPGGDDRIDDRALGDNPGDFDYGNPESNGHSADQIDYGNPESNGKPAESIDYGNPESKPDSLRNSVGESAVKSAVKTVVIPPRPEPSPKKTMDGVSRKFSLWKDATRKELCTPEGAQRVFEAAVAARICTVDERIHVFRLIISLRDNKNTKNLPGALISALRGEASSDPWRGRGIECESEARDWIRRLDVPEAMRQRTSNLSEDERPRTAAGERERLAARFGQKAVIR